ncbi:MAG: hypothetical protein ACYTGL_10265 [Planctomycetota bacterium]
MRSRPFYVLAIVLLTAVLPISIASQIFAARGATSAARAAGTRHETERVTLRSEARSHMQDSDRLSVLAAGIFACGVGMWCLSLSRKEGGLQGVPLLLTALGVLVQLLLV